MKKQNNKSKKIMPASEKFERNKKDLSKPREYNRLGSARNFDTHKESVERMQPAEPSSTEWNQEKISLELIQQRAYEIYEQRQREGRGADNLADWFDAERQLREERFAYKR